MSFVVGETWTRLRSPGKDSNGDPTGPVVETPVPDCAFAWSDGNTGSSLELFTDRRDSEVLDARLFCPGTADIKATDRLRAPNGDIFLPIGERQWYSPNPLTGWNTGRQVVQVRVVR